MYYMSAGVSSLANVALAGVGMAATQYSCLGCCGDKSVVTAVSELFS